MGKTKTPKTPADRMLASYKANLPARCCEFFQHADDRSGYSLQCGLLGRNTDTCGICSEYVKIGNEEDDD